MKKYLFLASALSMVLVLSALVTLTDRQIRSSSSSINSDTYKLPKPNQETQVSIEEAYGKLPLSFEANLGQTDDEVKFLSRGGGASLFLTRSEAVLALSRGQRVRDQKTVGRELKPASEDRSVTTAVVRMKLVGSNPAAKLSGLDELPGKSNYFIGNDPQKWRTNVTNYARVRYEDLYPGVDLIYYGNQRQLEYDFVVRPGADPDKIMLLFEGADKIEINNDGDLVLKVDGGEVYKRRPYVYQEEGGARQEIACNYVLKGDGKIGFEVAAYDTGRPLIIDPVLVYSTYLGRIDSEVGQDITVDPAGNAYVTGYTQSTNFPTANPFQAAKGAGADAFVTKLNPSGNGLVYSTFLGGNGGDVGMGIAVDSAGNAYVTGNTNSTNFPTANPFQAANGGAADAFVTKLNPSGNGLVYSTYLGGNLTEAARGITVDSAGNAYVTGNTNSTNFPTANPFQAAYGGGFTDAFVTKLNPSGNGLVYSTYLGGNSDDFCDGITIDSAGNAYVTGQTFSTNFPTTANPFQAAKGVDSDAFVTKLNPSGNGLVYSTYLGGNGEDVGAGIALDSAGNAYVTGFTQSTNFPTANPFQAANGGDLDVFVTKLNPSGNGLVYSTYLGGNDAEVGAGIAVDSAGNAYVTGHTNSTNFPTANPFQAAKGGFNDAFVTKLNPSGNGLVYSTYLGGNDTDYGWRLAVDSVGNAYVTGQTLSGNFPKANPFQAFNGGFYDAFVAKISPCTTITLSPLANGTAGVAYSQTITASGAGGTVAFFSTGTLPTGLSLNSATGEVSGLPTVAGTFSFTVTATDAIGCSGSRQYQIVIAPDNIPPQITAPPDVTAMTGPGATGCEALVSNATLGMATASDNLPGVTVSRSAIPAGNLFPVGTTTIIYTATDAAGNTASDTQTVTVIDNTPPAINAPAGVTAYTGAGATSCSLFIDNSTLGTATASDNCTSPITVNRSGVPSGNIFTVGTTTISYTATDAAGNTSTATQKVTLIDNTLPAVTAPANAGFQCLSQVPVAKASDATASDNCSTPTVTVSEINNGGIGSSASPLIITRTYTATDVAGNKATAIQTITVSDTTAPVFNSVPPAVTVMTGAGATSCGAVVSDATLGTATASDNCGGVTITRSGIPAGNLFLIGDTIVTYVAADAVGNTATATQKVTVVDNTPPTITTPQDVNVSTGAEATSCSVVVSDSVLGTATASDNCPGTVSISRSGVPSGNLFPVGTNTITYTATDAAGNKATATQKVTVIDNTPPLIRAPANAHYQCLSDVPAANAGDAVASDNCGIPTVTVSESNNGGAGSSSNPLIITRIYSASDAAGNTATATQTITVVDNIPPTISAPAAYTAFTEPTSCSVFISNSSLGTATAGDNCSGAVSINRSGIPAGNIFPVGITIITYTATDAASNTATATQKVIVIDNTPPDVTVPGAITVSANSSCEATVPNLLANVTASDNCTAVGGLIITQNPAAGTVVGLGTHNLTVTVTDAAGNSKSGSVPFNVVNNPPIVTAGGPYNVNEGGSVLVTASGSDLEGSPMAFAWDMNNDGIFETPGQSVNFSAAGLDGPGSRIINVKATDSCGAFAVAQATVNMLNVAPTLGAITAPLDPVQVNTAVDSSANFTDPGTPDTHTAVWDWGDGNTSPGTVSETNGSGSAGGSHSYTQAGVYTLKLTVTDDDGGSSQTIFQYIVIFDPVGGFVTGGGWINSPTGAYLPDPTLTGRATFGFVSKYQKGANVPTGNTEFQFRVANLNFKSSSYDWLVVAGARAQYKGSGTINGTGNYGFMLTAIDGQISGGGGTDKFRIKIWDKNNGDAVVYDNQMGATDDANPTTELGGGSIVIHKNN